MGLGHSWATPNQTSAEAVWENLKGVEDSKVDSVSSATSCRIEKKKGSEGYRKDAR